MNYSSILKSTISVNTTSIFEKNNARVAVLCQNIPAGMGKVDCHRYSIAIFFTFCSSNALWNIYFFE